MQSWNWKLSQKEHLRKTRSQKGAIDRTALFAKLFARHFLHRWPLAAPSLSGRTIIHHSIVTKELHRMSVSLRLCLCASSMPFAVEHRAMCKAHDPMREPFFSVALGIYRLIHCFLLRVLPAEHGPSTARHPTMNGTGPAGCLVPARPSTFAPRRFFVLYTEG